MKKINYELDQVNDLLKSSLLIVETQQSRYTIYKDNSRTHIINSQMSKSQVIETLKTIRELNYQNIIK